MQQSSSRGGEARTGKDYIKPIGSNRERKKCAQVGRRTTPQKASKDSRRERVSASAPKGSPIEKFMVSRAKHNVLRTEVCAKVENERKHVFTCTKAPFGKDYEKIANSLVKEAQKKKWTLEEARAEYRRRLEAR